MHNINVEEINTITLESPKHSDNMGYELLSDDVSQDQVSQELSDYFKFGIVPQHVKVTFF